MMTSSLLRCPSSLRLPQWLAKNGASHVLHRRVFTDCTTGMKFLPIALQSPVAQRAPSPAFERRRMTCMIDFLTAPHSLQSRHFAKKSAFRHKRRDPDMRNCQTIEEALQLAHEHFYTMSPRGISAFWAAVSKIDLHQNGGSGRRQGKSHQMNKQIMFRQFDAMKVRTLDRIKAFGYRDMARTAISLAKILNSIESHRGRLSKDSPSKILQDVLIGKKSEKKQFIFNRIALASKPVLQEFDSRSLSQFIYAFAKAGCSPKFEDERSIFDLVAIEAIPNLKDFDSIQFSNMLWAYAKAKESNSALFEQAGDAIVALEDLNDFKPQALSNLVWAYATAKESHPDLFKKVAHYIAGLDNLESFDEQALSNVVWACATAKEPHPDLFRKVADHIAGFNDLGSFNPQGLSNLVWAYSTAEQSSPELFRKLASHITGLDSLDQFNSQNLSNIAWAFATAKDLQPQLFQKLADAAIKRKHELNSQAISNLLWAYATNGQIDESLFSSFIPKTKALIGQCNSQELTNIAWAYAVADVDAPSLFDDCFNHGCLEKRDEFEVEDLRQLHQWHLWRDELKSNIRLPPSLEEKCYKAFVSEGPNPSALQNDVISALASLGLNPEEEVLTPKGYSLDAVVEVNGKKIGLEVDGPFHFLGRKPTGSTILKRRLIGNLEKISLVSVPYWEWDKLGRDINRKQQYLCSLLGLVNNYARGDDQIRE